MAGTEELTPPKYVDFADYIVFQIRRTQSLIRQIDVMMLLSTAAAALLLTSLLFVLLDHWGFAQGLPLALRWLGCMAILACLVVPAVYFFRGVSGRNISSLFAARTLERADTGFANNLMTLVDLDYHSRPASAAIRGSLEKRAALTLNELDVEHAIDRTTLLHRLYVLLAATIIFFGYSFLSPKSSLASLQRILFPWTTAVAPTQTRILDVQPGSGQVTAGSHVEVSAYIDGKAPEKVWLIYSTEDRRIVDERIELHQTDEGLGRYIGVITGENGRGVDQTTTYHLQAGDGRSPTYMLSVKPAPRAAIESIMIEPPTYTGRQPYRQPGGAIDGLEGSKVRLKAQTNIAVTKAWIQLYSSEDPGDRSGQLPLTLSTPTRLQGEWALKIQDDGTYPRFYSIQCESEDGANDPAPPLHAILIRPDERPEVRLLSPVSDLSRPINVALPLLIEAFDPDFELSGLSVQVEKQGQIVSSELIDAAGKQAIRTTHTLDLERLPVSPGETVSFWVEARDNRLPHPNRRSTPKLRLQILDPVDPAEAEKQAEEEKKKVAEASENNADPAASEEMTPDEPSTTEDMPRENQTEDEQNQSEGADGDQSTESQQPAEDSRKGKGQQSKKSEKGKQDESGQQKNGEKSEDGQKSDEPTFSPEGEDDDLVLEKLIERMKEKQNQPQDPIQPNEPGDNPSESPESKNDPNGQNMPEKNGQPDQEAEPNQPGEPPSDSQPKSDKPSSEQPSNQKGDSPSPSENEPGDDPSDSMPKEGQKPGETTEEGMKPGEESSEENAPGETMAPADDPSQNPTGTQQKPNSDAMNKQPGNEEGEKRPATPEEEMNGEKEPSKEPGQGESKPGEGTEEGAMERDPNGDPKSPPAQKPPGNVDAPQDQMQPPSGDPNQPTPPENQPPSDQPSQPGQTQPSKSQDGTSQPSQDSQNPDAGQPGDSPSDAPMKPAEEQKGTPQQSPNNQQTEPGKPAPADGKPGDQMPPNPNDSKQPGNSPTDQNPNGKPSDGKPSEGTPSDEMPSNEQPDNGKQPDNQQPGDQKSDGQKSDGQKSDGNKSDGQKSQDGQGQNGNGNKPSPGDGQPGKASPPMEDGPRGKGSPQPGGESNGRTAAPDPEGGPGPGGVGEGDAQNPAAPADNGGGEGTGPSTPSSAESLEDRRKAAELVLKEIEEDLKRGDVDPELLEDLNWTEDNLKQFQQRMADYLRQQNDEGTPDLKQQQFNEMLRNLRLDGERSTREGAATDRESRDEFAPTIMPAPPEYRELEEAFRRSLSGADQKN
ncbi:hypothetical protein [Rubinisphaera margarita]|uniref:hypothetical protein n=1 Tax=Rubinisphaera margarita TaxID=2909586 RepID=UPI001EE8A046|nr:hypothetical protein [Rubinisphaera margarita]MCG6156114.1 hypothetical protein [Rubinisphaera margarita]